MNGEKCYNWLTVSAKDTEERLFIFGTESVCKRLAGWKKKMHLRHLLWYLYFTSVTHFMAWTLLLLLSLQLKLKLGEVKWSVQVIQARKVAWNKYKIKIDWNTPTYHHSPLYFGTRMNYLWQEWSNRDWVYLSLFFVLV